MTLIQPENTAEIDETFETLVQRLDADGPTPTEAPMAHVAPTPADSGQADARLGRRVLGGLLVGFVAVTAMGFVLMTAQTPDQTLAARLGVAAFFGAWTSPFVGLSMAVGYHLVVEGDHEA
jgi:hypothetical protein